MGMGLLDKTACQTEMICWEIAVLNSSRLCKRLYLTLGTATVIATPGCNLFSEAVSIEGAWNCTTTNHLNGQKTEDRFVFGPANKLAMESIMQMHGTYEIADKAITLTVLEIPAMANVGQSTNVRHVIKGTISKLGPLELVLDTVNEKGTKRTSVCIRDTPTAEKQGSPAQTPVPAQNAMPPGQVQAGQAMPALPSKSADPRPMSAATEFPNLAARKGIGIFELIGATQGLEEQINAITKDKSSVFFSRLTGQGRDIVPAGAGGVFGTACMAHSCQDSAALYVRDNGAVAVAYIDTNSNELFYFSNIDQKEGIPVPVRLYAEEAMKESPGLTLHGIQTTNGISRVPDKTAEAPPIKQAPPPMPQSQQRPPAPQPSGKDAVARYADNLAAELERSSHPACRALASNIRSFGNSSAPDYVRQRQVDAIIERAPSICL